MSDSDSTVGTGERALGGQSSGRTGISTNQLKTLASRRRKRILVTILILGFLLIPLVLLVFSSTFQIVVSPEDARQKAEVSTQQGVSIAVGERYLLFSRQMTVAVKADGYVPEEIKIDKNQETRLIEVELLPLAGEVAIIVEADSPFDVYIDGIATPIEGLATLRLSPGTHELSISGTKLKPLNQTIRVEGYGKKESFRFAMETSNSHLSLSAEPTTAIIFLNDVQVGVGHFDGAVVPGNNSIRIQAEGYETFEETMIVDDDETHQIGTIKLKPLPGFVVLKASPSDVAVFIDSDFRVSTNQKFQVTANEAHQVLVRKSNYHTEERTVEVGPGQTAELSIALRPKRMLVRISAEPSSSVTLNDNGIGETPLSTEVSIGDVLKVSKSGYVSQETTIDALDSNKTDIHFKMLSPRQHAYANAPPETTIQGDIKLTRFPPVSYTLQIGDPDSGTSEIAGMQIEITRPFYLGKYEISVGQYTKFKKPQSGSSRNPRIPITDISWLEAAEYCNWLSRNENLEPVYEIGSRGVVESVNSSALGYRLPTEWEWETAATFDIRHQKVVQPYPWGTDLNIPRAYANLAGRESEPTQRRFLAGFIDNSIEIAQIGSYPPNFNDIHDLAGNVSEWTHDYFAVRRPLNAKEDYIGPNSGIDHVVKGSNYLTYDEKELHSNFRLLSAGGSENVGFRIARWIH